MVEGFASLFGSNVVDCWIENSECEETLIVRHNESGPWQNHIEKYAQAWQVMNVDHELVDDPIMERIYVDHHLFM